MSGWEHADGSPLHDPSMPMPGDQFINGVPADQYGMWCQHGYRVMVADPNDTTDYPGLVFTDPWPCPKCTPQQIEAETEEEAAQYEAERWAEARTRGAI
jgi:hypothetical protein